MINVNVKSKWIAWSGHRLSASFWVKVVKTMEARNVNQDDDEAVKSVIKEISQEKP